MKNWNSLRDQFLQALSSKNRPCQYNTFVFLISQKRLTISEEEEELAYDLWKDKGFEKEF